MDRSSALNIRTVGKIKGPHGLKGLVKVTSYTEPSLNLKSYRTVYISKDEGHNWGSQLEFDLRSNKKDFLGVIEGVKNREEALTMSGALIGVDRDAFGVLEEGEFFFWLRLVLLERTAQATTPVRDPSSSFLVRGATSPHIECWGWIASKC